MLVYTKYHRKSDRKQKTYKKIYVLIETFEKRERVNAPKDSFQDFDIVYIVKPCAEFF